MIHREITAGTEWASRDAARAEAMRAEREPTVRETVAEELHRIQWEGQRTPWFAGVDIQADGLRVAVLPGKAERVSTEVVTFPGTES